MKGPFVMAVDVGVSNVKAALIDRHANLAFRERRDLDLKQGQSVVARELVEACRGVLNAANLTTRDVKAVGCAMPGCVHPEDGVVVASATQFWLGVDVRAPLEAAFERPVHIEGDGNAAAIAAYHFGPTQGQNHLLGLNIGTGINCGFILNGKPLRGSGQAAMEAGHMPLFAEGKDCSCGRKGCWEAHAGGGALRRILADARAQGQPLPELPENLADRARSGDSAAIKIWSQQGKILGLGLAVLLNVLNPKSVVIGGGFAESWSLFRSSMIKTARDRSLGRNAESAMICFQEPETMSLLGVAAAASAAQGKADFFVDAPGLTGR